MPAHDLPSMLRRARDTLIRVGIDRLYRSASALARATPLADPTRYGIEVIRDVPYRNTGLVAHRLDVYRPTGATGPVPVVLYVHGGSFRILSKDTHFAMALAFARRGYLVLNVNYRLAPQEPYPAALEDCCAVYRWMFEHVTRFGGNTDRVILAGESAGANLITALAVATTYERPEPFARSVFDLGVVPRAVMPACGILQVTDIRRIVRSDPSLPDWLAGYLDLMPALYLGDKQAMPSPRHALADPLCILEQEIPRRALPPFFLAVGERDPIADDTKRLARALDRHGTTVESRSYPGGGHAFHAFLFTRPARLCWTDTFRFLAAHGLAPRLP